MAKFGSGGLYTTNLLYGLDPQYLLGVGDIASIAAVGMPTVNPGPVSINGVGNIYTAEAFGAVRISQIPHNLTLTLDVRRLRISPARRHLMVVP